MILFGACRTSFPNARLCCSSVRVSTSFRITTVKLKIPGKAFLNSESRTSVTFKL